MLEVAITLSADTAEILPFEHIRPEDVAAAGGKGANLGELVHAGFAVPPGFVVTTATYVRHVGQANLSQKLAVILDRIDASDARALDAIAAQAQALFSAGGLDGETRDEIERAYAVLGGGLVAVRSSATAEDSEEASFAGQQSTFLNISGVDDLLDAVVACWASLFEARAISYRARAGFDHASCAIAVVVQRMVASTRSGVAFTCDPVGHSDDVIVIEAVRGLGEALVSGAVTPDMYVLDKRTLTILERTIVDQPRQLVHAGGGGLETNEWGELPALLRTRPKLADEEIVRLAEAVRGVEAHYGRPQDIEWAEADGAFYILQSRPVTTLDHAH